MLHKYPRNPILKDKFYKRLNMSIIHLDQNLEKRLTIQ